MGLRAGVDTVEKRKSLYCRESNPGSPARTPLAIPTALSRLPGLVFIGQITTLHAAQIEYSHIF
jgi:hypothetical protein